MLSHFPVKVNSPGEKGGPPPFLARKKGEPPDGGSPLGGGLVIDQSISVVKMVEEVSVSFQKQILEPALELTMK